MNSISIGFAVLAFIVFTIASMNSWKTNEEFYKHCMDNTRNVEYCSKYLKE